jgi:hypothetical protein
MSSGAGAPYQCALASGVVNQNGEYTVYSVTESERESTDKPPTSVVGN